MQDFSHKLNNDQTALLSEVAYHRNQGGGGGINHSI